MENKLITFQELVDNPDDAFKRDKLNHLLNRPPRQDWLKKNKFANNMEYLPVDKHEWLLAVIFGKWRREIKSVTMVGNSILAIVRIHYRDPITGEWEYHDGTGAAPLQTDSGAGAMAVEAMKTNAVQLAAPAAVSYALKDACECLGKLFGKDLNKKDALEFKGMYQQQEETEPEPQPTTLQITTNF